MFSIIQINHNNFIIIIYYYYIYIYAISYIMILIMKDYNNTKYIYIQHTAVQL